MNFVTCVVHWLWCHFYFQQTTFLEGGVKTMTASPVILCSPQSRFKTFSQCSWDFGSLCREKKCTKNSPKISLNYETIAVSLICAHTCTFSQCLLGLVTKKCVSFLRPVIANSSKKETKKHSLFSLLASTGITPASQNRKSGLLPLLNTIRRMPCCKCNNNSKYC